MEAALKADQALVTTGLDHRLILHRLIAEIATARIARRRAEEEAGGTVSAEIASGATVARRRRRVEIEIDDGHARLRSGQA
jgi:predicted aspartyl protease